MDQACCSCGPLVVLMEISVLEEANHCFFLLVYSYIALGEVDVLTFTQTVLERRESGFQKDGKTFRDGQTSNNGEEDFCLVSVLFQSPKFCCVCVCCLYQTCICLN